MNKCTPVKDLFNKKFEFQNNDTLELPEEAYNSAKWSISVLQENKEQLNQVKSLLNEFDLDQWSRHTKHRDPSSYIARFIKQKFQPELLTQAWCKFNECLSNFSLIPNEAVDTKIFSSLHICEAPGAFVSALNHHLQFNFPCMKWEWCANSLNPDYEGNTPLEMIADDRLLRHTYKNWYFGQDFTGDITKYHNYQNILQKFPEKVWLVTADGSVDCMQDPGNQEKHVEYLHYCETITALSMLKPGGSFVLKIFTMFEDSTVCLLYLLNLAFKKVAIFKPASSKSGNSEVYCICVEYKGIEVFNKIWVKLLEPFKQGHFNENVSMFDLTAINNNFVIQIKRASRYFMEKQISKITDNISYFNTNSQAESGRIHQIKVAVANHYINKFKLSVIPNHLRLVPNLNISQFWINHVKKYVFVRGVIALKVKRLIPTPINKNIINIRLGQAITQIRSSRFCTKESLDKFKFNNKVRVKSILHENIVKLLSKTCTILNFDDFSSCSCCELQKHIFYEIFNSSKKNFVIVKIPLLTNFLVGLMYIFVSCFDKVYFHYSGAIILSGACEESLNRVKEILKLVDETYRSDNNNYCSAFSCDISHIVSPNVVYNNDFFDFVWNYNNLVLSKCA